MPSDANRRFTDKGLHALDELCGSSGLSEQEQHFYKLYRDEMLSAKQYSERLDLPLDAIKKMRRDLEARLPDGWKRTSKKKSTSEVYSFRFEKEHRNLVQKAAEQQGVKLSDFIRDSILKMANDQIQATANESAIDKLSASLVKQIVNPTMNQHQLAQLSADSDYQEVEIEVQEYKDRDLWLSGRPLDKGVVNSLRLALENAPFRLASVLRDKLLAEDEQDGFEVVNLNEA